MSAARLIIAAGVFLAATAVILPSSALVSIDETVSREVRGQLLRGAILFKVNLAVLGAFVVFLAKVFRSGAPLTRPAAGTRGKSGAALAAILVATLALRLYQLDAGLWLDEILTYVDYVQKPFGGIFSAYQTENQHPLFSLLARASLLIFGDGAWQLRLSAVLFGVGSVWALFLLARDVADTREALLSSALLAFSYHHVWFSQNARGYTGLLFWTLLSGWLFLRAIRERRIFLWAMYAVSVALGVFTHMTMVFVAAGHFVAYLWILRKDRAEAWSNRYAGFFTGFCLAGILALQLHSLVLPQILGTLKATVSVVDAWKDPLWTLAEVFQGLQISFAGGIAAAIALLLFGAGLLSYFKREPLVLVLACVPPIVGATAVIAAGHHLWPRFFFFTLGFAVLIVVRGAMVLGAAVARRLGMPSGQAAWPGTALCVAMLLVSLSSVPRAYGPKQDYLGALSFVESEKVFSDAVVTAGYASIPYVQFYKLPWQTVSSARQLDSIRSSSKRTWLLYTLAPVTEAMHPDIMETVKRDFKIVRQFHGTLREGAVYVCLAENPAAGL